MEPKDAIAKLHTLGWKDVPIALAVGSSQSVISRIKRGERKASYAVGAALVDLARKGRKPPRS